MVATTSIAMDGAGAPSITMESELVGDDTASWVAQLVPVNFVQASDAHVAKLAVLAKTLFAYGASVARRPSSSAFMPS